MLEQSPNDVRFTFAGSKLQLWASSATLKNASPYLETLLTGPFQEGQNSRAQEESSSVSPIAAERDFEDSDDETDQVFEDQRRSLAKPRSDHSAPYKNVVVKKTAFTTYAAVLLWLATRNITFAQPRSAPGQTRIADLTAANAANPRLPLPASPKSIYRLAHLLELEDLRTIALNEFSSQLQVDNAAVELFSDTAGV